MFVGKNIYKKKKKKKKNFFYGAILLPSKNYPTNILVRLIEFN